MLAIDVSGVRSSCDTTLMNSDFSADSAASRVSCSASARRAATASVTSRNTHSRPPSGPTGVWLASTTRPSGSSVPPGVAPRAGPASSASRVPASSASRVPASACAGRSSPNMSTNAGLAATMRRCPSSTTTPTPSTPTPSMSTRAASIGSGSRGGPANRHLLAAESPVLRGG